MNILNFTLLIFCCSFGTGILGSFTGLGGGIILVPILTLVFDLNPYYAMGSSLIASIATSSGASVGFIREGFLNLRIGIFLETSAVIGAVIGASVVTMLPLPLLGILFGIVLLYSAITTLKQKKQEYKAVAFAPSGDCLDMGGSYLSKGIRLHYQAHRIWSAWLTMLIAGGLSGILGIGSGSLKVLAMDQFMKLPYKVSTATSNFMIGLTATAGAGIYLAHGYVDPILCVPIMLGILSGSFLGTRLLVKIKSQILRYIFVAMTVILGVQMIIKSIIGKF